MTIVQKTLIKKKNIKKRKKENLLNDYSGSEWAQASKSVFKFDGTIAKKRKKHGAAFPFSLAKHVIETYSKEGDLVFDPFLGVGTTTDACMLLNRRGIGIDINQEFIRLAEMGPDPIDGVVTGEKPKITIICDDVLNTRKHVKRNSIDLILTSPPYGNLLRIIRPKFADKMSFKERMNGSKLVRKDIKNPQAYSDLEEDLGNMDYKTYLKKIDRVFKITYDVAKNGTYAVWVIKDYRDLQNRAPYVNLHGDIIKLATKNKWLLWDIIIWNQTERRPLVVLGYPSRNFYANIGHSFLLVFKKNSKIKTNNLKSK